MEHLLFPSYKEKPRTDYTVPVLKKSTFLIKIRNKYKTVEK